MSTAIFIVRGMRDRLGRGEHRGWVVLHAVHGSRLLPPRADELAHHFFYANGGASATTGGARATIDDGLALPTQLLLDKLDALHDVHLLALARPVVLHARAVSVHL